MAVEKLLPQNVEAEAGVLGSLLIDPEAIVQVAEFLKPDDFYREAHRTVYQAALDLYESGGPADFITLCDELGRRGKLEELGGTAYVGSLANQVPTSRNALHYARIVERTAILRRLIHAAGQIAGVAYNEPDADVAMEQAEKLIFDVGQRSSRSDFDSVGEILRQYIDKLDQLHEHRGDIVGVASGFSDLDKLTGGLQKSDLVILAARPSVGKCLTAHTLIDDPVTGARLTIEECIRQCQPLVFGLSADGRVRTTPITDWIDSGVQPVFRVQTHSGREVEVTGHHPFLTVRGWVPLHDLTVGDTIAVPCAVPAFGSDESWPIELVRLLAYFIAEGGLTDSSPEFTNTDPVIVEDFKQIIAAHFPACAIKREKITYIVAQPRTPEYERGGVGRKPNPTTVWLKGLGLWNKLARDKFFPACVWTWSKHYLTEFIKVMMSCEGSIYPSSKSGYPRIEFGVASRQLAADMQHALTRFAIISKFYRTTQGAWRVEITAPEAVRRYQEEIGWIGEKVTRFAGLVRELPKRISTIGHPPQETWALVRSAVGASSLTMTELARRSGETEKFGKYVGYNPHTGRSLPRHRLVRYANVLGDTNLRRLASTAIYWDPIIAIEPIGDQQVYDLTVPDGENFIAQDIFVHNTALALSLAHNSALRFGHSVAIFSLEMSKEQLVSRLLSMDAMVDQQRLRTGWIEDDEWARISESVGRLSQANIYIDDTAGIPMAEMRSKARRLMLDRGFDLLVVDYLQLMQGSGAPGKGENRQQEISEISRGLKALARELNVPVLALSQLSRAVESRADKKPQLSDLRESGCLAGETPVYLPETGTYAPIASLVGQSGFRVLALNTETWKLEPATVSRAFATGRKSVLRLTTRLGRSLRATGNHKFLTIQGWQRLDKLEPGTRLALPRTLPGPQQVTMTDNELALLGHLIGDGCVLPTHAVQYTTNDQDLAEEVADLARRVFGGAIVPRVHQEGMAYGGAWYQVYLAPKAHLTHGVRNPVQVWVERLGILGLRSYQKRIPPLVFAQPSSSIARFLRHLWATDGTAFCSDGRRIPTITYATSSPYLAHDVQSLLLRLGVNARVIRVPQPGKGRDQYHVDVSGKPDQESFIGLVGIAGVRKQAMLEQVRGHLTTRLANTNRDVLPHDVRRLYAHPARRSAGLTDRQLQAALGNQYCGTGLYRQNVSRERGARLALVVASPELTALANSDVYWDEIVTIEPDGEEEVFDLTVDGLHNFVAGNIVAHNSLEQDADVVLFIYRDEVYNPETDRKHIADIIVAKHRNGPVGQVGLFFQTAQTRFRDLELYRPDDV